MAGAIDIASTGNLVNLGNSVDSVQWENSHVSTRFPFDDDVSLVSSDGAELPCSFLVDFSVFTDGDPCTVVMSSAYIGPAMASVSFSDSSGPLCSCTVLLSSYEQYAPVVMTPEDGRDASGVCSFGFDVGSIDGPKLFRFSPGVRMALSSCFHIDTGRVRRFIDSRSGETASGDVGLRIGSGLTAYLSNMEDGVFDIRWPVGFIYMSNDTKDSVTSYCSNTGNRDGELFIPTPIRSINGVSPDCDGRIAIVFR